MQSGKYLCNTVTLYMFEIEFIHTFIINNAGLKAYRFERFINDKTYPLPNVCSLILYNFLSIH